MSTTPTNDGGNTLLAAWTNNCRGVADDSLYVIHGYVGGNKTLCGRHAQEVGDPIAAEDIGCFHCQRTKQFATRNQTTK